MPGIAVHDPGMSVHDARNGRSGWSGISVQDGPVHALGGHTVQNSVNYVAYWADNVNVPPSDRSPVPDSLIHNEIVRAFTLGFLAYDSNTVYAVFAAGPTNFSSLFDHGGCAYHSSFTWSGHVVTYAALPEVYRASPYVNP
jgi:hypothetical protein